MRKQHLRELIQEFSVITKASIEEKKKTESITVQQLIEKLEGMYFDSVRLVHKHQKSSVLICEGVKDPTIEHFLIELISRISN